MRKPSDDLAAIDAQLNTPTMDEHVDRALTNVRDNIRSSIVVPELFQILFRTDANRSCLSRFHQQAQVASKMRSTLGESTVG